VNQVYLCGWLDKTENKSFIRILRYGQQSCWTDSYNTIFAKH